MRVLMITLIALLPFAAAADTAPTIQAPATPGMDQVTSFTLENGMEVVVIEDHRAPVVVHMVWYRAGAADEPPGSSGVAHFLEHLMFKGTKKMAPGEFSAIVSRQGGDGNAFTTQDYTAYFQRIAADRLGLMMSLESDRMVNLQLDEQNVATERDVVIEERNMRVENNPGALFREQQNAAQYLNSPYGTPVIGWANEMPLLTLKDATGFYGTYYAPNDAVLVVAGDVTPDAVRTLAEKYYGAIPANPDLPPRDRPQEPRQLAARHLTFHDARIPQPYLTRSYLAPQRKAGDQKQAAALSILAEILGGGTTSLMAEKMQFEGHVAVQSSAWYGGVSLDPTTFHFVVVPVPGVTLPEAEKALDDVLQGFLKDGVDPAQLKRIKMQVRASQIYARDDVEGLANDYGAALTSGLTVADVQTWPDVLQSVTADDVMQAARDLLEPRNSVTGYLSAPANAAASAPASASAIAPVDIGGGTTTEEIQ